MVEDFDYEAPQNLGDLCETVRFLIRKYKKKAIVALLKIHPDREALLSIEKQEEDQFCSACSEHNYNSEDNYCGSCGHSNYTGNKSEFLAQLEGMSKSELDTYYQNLLKKSKLNPDDQDLSEEVQMVWNHIRLNKEDDAKESDERPAVATIAMEQSMFIGVFAMVFVVGVIVGTSLKTG